MSKHCARCEKVVYPIEELKCLDKVWHKGCFKCNECSMTLSMKTYKGFHKMPYCDAHIPKAKATTVAETPESKRLAENTKIQSNVQYHADFEKNKARFTQVSDDPETLRLQQNTKNISNVNYHNEREKKADMEHRRDKDGQSASPDQPPMDKLTEPTPAPQSVPVAMSQRPVPSGQYTGGGGGGLTKQQQQQQQYNRMAQQQVAPPAAAAGNNRYYQNQPATVNYGPPPQSQYPMPPHQQPPPAHRNPTTTRHHHHQQQQAPPSQQQQYHHQYNNPPGTQHAYPYHDPNRNQPPQQQYGARPSQTLVYSSQTGPIVEATENVGSIADYDPVNNQYGSTANAGRQQAAPAYRQDSNKGQRGHYHREGAQQVAMHNQQMGQQHSHQKINAPPTNLGRCYRAVYDYEAADADEVSFKDGDLIVNCTSIDEGWMTGTVQRSGHLGMLPANYVQRVS